VSISSAPLVSHLAELVLLQLTLASLV
jgi:hypothetical protein